MIIGVPDELIQNSEPDPYQACMDKVRSAMLSFADLNDGCRVPGPAPQCPTIGEAVAVQCGFPIPVEGAAP